MRYEVCVFTLKRIKRIIQLVQALCSVFLSGNLFVVKESYSK